MVSKWERWLTKAGVWWMAQWVWWVTGALLVYTTLPFLAPITMFLGWESVGRWIYWLYVPFCHQLPERSFFLFGERWVYSASELAPWLSPEASWWVRKLFVGNESIGYKVAFCQRDTAIYGAMTLASFLYGWGGRRWHPLPWKWYGVLLLPVVLDGGTQLLMWRESTWGLRVVTGALMGGATVWAFYPRVERAIRQTSAPG